ncbi:MAG TPA: helix-turn-helix domain-containing protein [Solirubrobacteraceae bacterium]|nr:helix-turn-helix domain-containing protein [Solirubrobacteraceae bacterium]
MPAQTYIDPTKIDDYPWRQLDPAIVGVLRPVLDETAQEMIEAVVASVPAYARPIEGEFGVGIVAGVQAALSHLLAEIEESGPVGRPDVYRALGQGEMRAGRSLDSLLTAYRIGARVAWRRFAAAGVEAGLEPDTLYLLAEGIFAYIDVLSTESAEGHAAERSAAAGEAELRRRRLVRMLVREPPADAAAVRAAATAAEWRLPRSLAVLAIGGEQRGLAVPRLPLGTISEDFGEVTCAVLGDPDGPGRRVEIERAVHDAGAIAGLGTTVEWGQAALSFQRARAALALAGPEPGVLSARENAGRLLLAADPPLAAELADTMLAPLEELAPGSRARLRETLRAWLAEQGRLAQVAERLGVHPQTARYRLGRLRELFGADLADPDRRFWLELALRAAPDDADA